MWPFKKKEEYQVYFTCDEWAIRQYAPIQSAKKFLPLSFKGMDTFLMKKEHAIDSVKTVKSCPAIVDFCSSGFVIPAWCDMEINPSPNGQNVSVRYSHPRFKQGEHLPPVVQNFMSNKFNVRTSVKLDNPWFMWASKGYSLMYFPMYYYDDSKNWEALPGIIDHDVGALQNPINIMLKEPKQTVIKMGEPLVQVIPFKREEITAYTGAPNDVTQKRYFGLSYLHNMSFGGWMKYMREPKSFNVDAHDVELPTNPKKDSND